MKYKSYTLANFKKLPQIVHLSKEEIFDIEVVAQVFPFKANNYLTDKLIDWDNYRSDPMFKLVFPQKDMLLPEEYERIADLMRKGADKKEILQVANEIRFKHNPQPAGQLDKNVPTIDGNKLSGSQHKYRETILFFPKQGQTCHAYCTFCFRWPQFIGIDSLKFASKEVDILIKYIARHPEITDILFTGGDPLIMSTKLLRAYIEPILKAKKTIIPHLRTIRFGTKSVLYWPYRYLTQDDSDDLLDMFREIRKAGLHVTLPLHINHWRELSTKEVQLAIERILETGVVLRAQSPILRPINAQADTWAKLWQKEVELNIIPYYMFMARDTGAQHYFGVPLAEAWDIYRKAYSKVSGIARTVRGPSMSATPGKILLNGIVEINGKKYFNLQFIQGRDPDWVGRPFFAHYDPNAMWIDELKPAFDDKFFFEHKMKKHESIPDYTFW